MNKETPKLVTTLAGLTTSRSAVLPDNPVVRVETYRRPFNAREWQGGKARRTSFSGAWTRDGKYHDLD